MIVSIGLNFAFKLLFVRGCLYRLCFDNMLINN